MSARCDVCKGQGEVMRFVGDKLRTVPCPEECFWSRVTDVVHGRRQFVDGPRVEPGEGEG